MRRTIFHCVVLCYWFFASVSAFADAKITLLRTPNNGIQPQAVVDAQGTLHLIYFKGESSSGTLFYVKRPVGSDHFTEPMRVTVTPNSAMATGTVRGGQIAIGKNGRVHVAWNGAGQASGMLYTRLNDAGTAFEAAQQLMRLTAQADGGCTLAADETGHVAVAWHAVKAGDKGEDHRSLWIARSVDDGKSFANEETIWQEPTGACGCCSTRGFADRQGAFYFLYRSATGGNQRDVYLLNAKRHDAIYQGKLVHPWKTATCPMSTLAMAQGPAGVVAAWDTQGKIYTTTIHPGTFEFSEPRLMSGRGQACKHPSLAMNDQGYMLLAWTEGTGWQRGGNLSWQLFDPQGKPQGDPSRLEKGVPVWGLPSVVTDVNGFLIVH